MPTRLRRRRRRPPPHSPPFTILPAPPPAHCYTIRALAFLPLVARLHAVPIFCACPPPHPTTITMKAIVTADLEDPISGNSGNFMPTPPSNEPTTVLQRRCVHARDRASHPHTTPSFSSNSAPPPCAACATPYPPTPPPPPTLHRSDEPTSARCRPSCNKICRADALHLPERGLGHGLRPRTKSVAKVKVNIHADDGERRRRRPRRATLTGKDLKSIATRTSQRPRLRPSTPRPRWFRRQQADRAGHHEIYTKNFTPRGPGM